MPDVNERQYLQLNLRVDLGGNDGNCKLETGGVLIPNDNQGSVGDKGPTGDKGPEGNSGPDGNKGPDGNPGPNGKQGPDGNKGPNGDPFIVAAGCFDQNGNQSDRSPYFSYNNLQATQLSDPTLYHLKFDAYRPKSRFIIKGDVLCSFNSKMPSSFQVVLPDANLRKLLKENGIMFGTGIVVKVAQVNGEISPCGFTVEISAFGDFSG